MTTRHLFTAALAIVGTITTAFAANPMVSNLTPGIKLGDITRGISADTPTGTVAPGSSEDARAICRLPSKTVSDAVATEVVDRLNKTHS